MIVPLLFAINR